MSFQLSDGAAGMIVLTMVDHAANEFMSASAPAGSVPPDKAAAAAEEIAA